MRRLPLLICGGAAAEHTDTETEPDIEAETEVEKPSRIELMARRNKKESTRIVED
jgi:hypothetical protein